TLGAAAHRAWVPQRIGAGADPGAGRTSGGLSRGFREYLSPLHRGRAQGPARTGAGARLPRSTGRPARPAVRRPGRRELARRVGLAEVGLVTRPTRFRLCIMMFLEFFIWGAWFVTLGSYLAANLHASGAQNARAYYTPPWGAHIAPVTVRPAPDPHSNARRPPPTSH